MRKLFLYPLLVTLIFISCTSNLNNKDLRNPDSLTQELRNSGALAWENLSEARKAEVNTVRTNLMKFMLEASFKSDEEKYQIVKNAERYLEVETTKVMLNIKTEKLSPNNMTFYKIEAPPAWTLKEEVKWLTEMSQAETIATPIRADVVYSTLASMNIDQIDAGNELSAIVNEDISNFVAAVKSSNSQRTIPLLVVNKFEERLDEYFEKIKNLGTELKASGQLDLGNPEAEKFLVLFLDYYYSNVDQDVIKNIINDIIVLGREPESMEMVKLMFQNSGPGLGKTLQQLGKEPSMGESLQEVIEVLEDDGKPVPYHLVKKIVDEDEAGFVITNISKNPLGTGTMAQVNKAKLKQGNKKIDIALRFLKPGIEKRADDDIRILKDFIERMGEEGELSEDFLPTARKLVESISEFLKSELDIPDAIKKQEYANQAYEGIVKVKQDGKVYDIDINVPDVYKPKDGKKTNLHLQEFVTFGKKYSEIENIKSRKVIAEAIMRAWFQEGLIDSGFIHSDLHQGNFTVNKIGQSTGQVTLFDFGMSETLRLDTRKAFLLIGSGAQFSNAKLIADGMAVGRNLSKSKKKALIKAIESQIDKIKKSEEWIIWGLREGHLVNDQLGTLARGGTLVSQLGRLVDDEEMAENIVEDLLKENIRKGYFSLNYNFPLSRTEVLRVGMASVGDSCSSAIRKFFRTK